MIAARSGLSDPRFGIAVGRRIGGAVKRNKIKRRLRAVLTKVRHRIDSGWDIILIARAPILEAKFATIETAVLDLLHRAALVSENATE